MYQPCTSTAVNHGEQRGLAADLQSALTRQNTRLPGRSLITRRSQVQILPPPLNEMPGNMEFPGVSRFQPARSSTGSSTGRLGRDAVTCGFVASIR